MRITILGSLVVLAVGCGAAPRLPPDVALMARYPVVVRGVPGGAALKRVVVVQDEVNGPRIDRAVAEALRRTGRTVELLPPGTTGADAASRLLRADAVVRLSLTVKREAKGQGSERVQIVRPKTGFSAYITPPTPTGMPDGVLYPTQATEHTTVEMPVDQHFIDAIVGITIVRAADGQVVAAWEQDLGATRVARPVPAPRGAAAGSQPVEEVAPTWVALLASAGSEMVHWLDEPRVEVERPLWLIPRGPREAVAATRRGLDAVANGVWDVAERELRAAVAAFGDDPRTHANLAVVLERRGDRVGARAELHAAARLERGAESRFGRLLHEFNRTFLSFATGPLGRRAASQPAGAPASQPANAPAP